MHVATLESLLESRGKKKQKNKLYSVGGQTQGQPERLWGV